MEKPWPGDKSNMVVDAVNNHDGSRKASIQAVPYATLKSRVAALQALDATTRTRFHETDH
jgi:hypothetical protein